ncbi:Spiroplasmavirus-related protein [Spiroplasma kunkelii CR2-3x]|uniref:Spiroplasmavirus-related protein n=1 Tax=Spiroplasma kunkelii CR2-3x TaxID=273035 RepID=A0A0K2JFL3_SPIKU|nr:Spiroplasmavirus-related protein [Spiroplasma kunkelii CR2-3x]
MKKSLSLFAIFILSFLGLVIPFITLTAFRPLNGEHYTLKQEKNSIDKGINETDFINTMFLRSIFFENWSETNYFINPTLKTSKKLLFNDKWYLDFLQDSYSTGVVYDKPSSSFFYYFLVVVVEYMIVLVYYFLCFHCYYFFYYNCGILQ